jgi:hypothetical protein
MCTHPFGKARPMLFGTGFFLEIIVKNNRFKHKGAQQKINSACEIIFLKEKFTTFYVLLTDTFSMEATLSATTVSYPAMNF